MVPNGDAVGDLIKSEATLNQHGLISSWLDNEPPNRLCKGCLTQEERDGVLHQVTWPPQSPDLNPLTPSVRVYVSHKT